ncbi:MAG: ParB/RepB/Spo0J family partition protein [Dehalococcoidia bacterium]
MSQPRRGLGRGLDALLRSSEPPPQVGSPDAGPVESGASEIDIDLITANPQQPRSHFPPEQLEELADSIREHGIIQPLVVSRVSGGGFQLIAGERRLQAARLAGLKSVPVVTRQAEDARLLELALVENIQRQDLNPVEEALAFRRLVDEYGLTQDEVARQVGRSRTAISNSLRLLGLEPEIRRSLVAGEVSEGHARALLGLPGGRDRLTAWRTVVKRGLSVRETESLVRRSLDRPGRDAAPDRDRPADGGTPYAVLESRLRQALGTRVAVRSKGRGARITIDCYSDEELNAVTTTLLGDDE